MSEQTVLIGATLLSKLIESADRGARSAERSVAAAKEALDYLEAERVKVAKLENLVADLDALACDVLCGGAWDAGAAEARIERLVRAATIALAHIQSGPADWGVTRAWELLHDALEGT